MTCRVVVAALTLTACSVAPPRPDGSGRRIEAVAIARAPLSVELTTLAPRLVICSANPGF